MQRQGRMTEPSNLIYCFIYPCSFMNREKFVKTSDPDAQATGSRLLLKDGSTSSTLSRCRTVLLISDDARFYHRLRIIANSHSQLIVRTESVTVAVPILHAVRADAVLLDLDLAEDRAWSAAEALLKDPVCPPVILLSARGEQFDEYSAFRAGSLVSKSEEASCVMDIVEAQLATASNQA